jgi:hypothetical protein
MPGPEPLRSDIVDAILTGALDPAEFAELLAAQYPGGFLVDDLHRTFTRAEQITLGEFFQEAERYAAWDAERRRSWISSLVMDRVLAGTVKPRAGAEQLVALGCFGAHAVWLEVPEAPQEQRRLEQLMQHVTRLLAQSAREAGRRGLGS